MVEKINLTGEKCYVSNCTLCNRLFMRNKENAEKLGMKWTCPECFTENELKEEDLI